MSHISTPQLHGYRYGELPPDVRASVESHLAACDRCAKRHALQLREREAFVAMPVPPAILAASAPPPRSWWANTIRWLSPAAIGLAAAAAIALVVIRPGDDGIRSRGDGTAEIEAWIATEAGPRALRPDETVHAGSVLQLSYDPEGASHVWLAGRDGTGTVEVYGPVHPARPEGLQPAPFSLTLDDAAGPQEFFAVRSDRPLDADAVKAALAGDVEGISVARLAIPKE